MCLIAAALAGCGRAGEVHVVAAEFQDETPDGIALQNESVLVLLDRPLPPAQPISGIRIATKPHVEWSADVVRTADPRVLQLKIRTGNPAFRVAGLHGKDPAATGIGIDLGDGVLEWVDLQAAPSLPVLERAIWEDRYPPEGNLVADQGDGIRLIFDRPVALQVEGGAVRVLVPQDLILSKSNADRLDDGEFFARFERGQNDREVLLVLGSRPILTVTGILPDDPAAIDRFGAAAPSGLALNGTPLLAMPKITDARGGAGAISRREVDVEFPEGCPQPRMRPGEAFPPPGNRIFHTVTPVAAGRALIAGGASADNRQSIDQVLVYDPVLAESKPSQAFTDAAGRLPHPIHLHTATLLAGPDGESDTFDDVVLLAGGTDGERSFGDLTVLAPRDDGSVAVEALPAGLRAARAEHAAVATAPNQVLVDGGKKTDAGGLAGLVECAELLTLAFGGDGKPRIAEHRAFRTLARSLHTLTLLPPADDGSVYVLAYGGFGCSRRRLTAIPHLGEPVAGVEAICSTDSAAVLASPFLIRIDSPERSFELEYELNFAFLRWGHVAVPIEPGGVRGLPPRSARVLIAGGSVRHPTRGFDGDRRLWELTELKLDYTFRPREHAASSPILFRFDAARPRESRFEVLSHPSTDPGRTPERIFFAAVPVPDRGVVIAGGELRDGTRLGDSEIFLAEEQRLCELAVRLTCGRSRHQGYVVTRGGKSSLFLIGGITSGADRVDSSAVEEVPLK